MNKLKTVIIYVLSVALALETGTLLGSVLAASANDEKKKNMRPTRVNYRNYRDYENRA